MGSIVIVMPGHKDAVRLQNILLRSGLFSNIILASRGAEVLQEARLRNVALVLCTRRLSDMGYEELSSLLPSSVSILLLTQDAALVPFSPAVTRLLMPFRAEDLVGAVRSLLPDGRQARKKKPLRSPEEQAKIDRAKALLMEGKHLTEPEAFRYLQKTSMDTGRTLLETALMVTDLYGRPQEEKGEAPPE